MCTGRSDHSDFIEYGYCNADYGDEPDFCIIAGVWEELEDVAQAAAGEYHYHNRDESWPITITLFSEDDAPLGDFEVVREMVPVFHATRKVEPCQLSPKIA